MKRNIKKKVISAVTTVSLIAALSAGCVMAKSSGEQQSETDGIKVIYDGETVSFDVDPEIINDRVMVQMRTIFEAFGAKVKWDGDTQTITSKKKSKTITMTIGSTDMTKNDETYTFDTAPVIEDGSTLIPIRAISEMLGLDVEWDEDTQTVIITTPEDEDDDAWKSNTGTIDLNTLKTTGEGVSVSGNIITITQGGDFEVTGTLDDGQIVIDTKDKVKLRLSGMSLTNKSGSAVYIKNADKAYITLTEGTENTLTDGEEYTGGDENEKGTITSRDNLEIKGKGSLTINANYNNGIDGSDSVEIENGNITINAVNDGINANDTLAISGGVLNVNAESDGLQAGDIVDITGGEVNITTTGEVQASSSEQFGFGGMGGRGMGGFGGQENGEMKDPQSMTDEEREEMFKAFRESFEKASAETDDESDESEDVTSKGIKADWLIDISGGTVNINSTDHAIHSASDIEISGGTITLASEKKKGISAHGDVTIDGGTINITKSTEGIEAKQIMTINDGDINIVASDDGLNAGGGNGMGGGMPGGMGGFGGQRDRDSLEDGTDSTASDETGINSANQQRGFGGRGMKGGMRGGMQGGDMTPPDMSGEGMTPPDMSGEGMTPPDMDGMTSPQMGGGRGMRGGNMTEMPEGMDNMTPPDMESGENGENNGGQRGGFGGGMGQSRETDEISTEHHIQINGGTIYIEAQGDGIDSNGTIQIDGGTVTVNAQVMGAESAFDADSAILFNGGTIIGVSGAGLDESPNSYSKQNVIIAYTTSTLSEGDKVKVTDSNGNTIIETTAAIGGSKIVVSTPDIKTGESYTVTAGSETLTAEVESVITSVGTKSSGMGGGRGGMRGMGQQSRTGEQTQ